MTANHLTLKQALFVKEYIVDFNATRAAKAAGYSPKTAFTIGVENLKKPLIQALLATETKKRAERVERTADEVVLRLWRMHDIDFSDYPDKRQVKTIELLLRHYGLLNDKLQVGMDEATLNTILNTLPPEQAEKTKAALMAIAKKK